MSEPLVIPRMLGSQHRSLTPFHTLHSASKSAELSHLRRRLAAAKWRCEHATGSNRVYAGIIFDFPSPAIGARLLLGKLGPMPRGRSLDRIDPRGPYSIDNLRYASPLLQVLNRRRKSSVSHWTKDHG